MKDGIVGTGLIFIVGTVFWLAGFGVQKTQNRAMTKDYCVLGSGVWSYLFGMRPLTERIYLRPAVVQLIGIALAVVGLPAVWLGGMRAFSVVLVVILLGGLFGSALAFAIADLVVRVKTGKKRD